MDTIAQFLTRIRNAGIARHEKVDIPASKLRVGLAEILVGNGLIRSYKVAKDSKQGVMRVYLKYSEDGEHVISKIERVSRPGRRVYVKSTGVPVVRSGLGMTILSTSQGLMSGQDAQKKNLGGELICKVW
ncbi:MAG: 30S ribosomal protein S8 [Bdellovibrio sp. CG10_big_fil_rev_8_21_14_0_10_47_8]|nr:MAG: 30S ribosomal protein S8 [Bdellovibrio sp. CG10_big_fil_rev_8_21_14_0_10_47_8]